MSSINERSCSLLVHYDKPASYNEIKDALEGSDPEAKVLAMKKAVMAILNGEQMPQLFITIVRYVLPSEDHAVQKLLLLYLVRSQRSGQRAATGWQAHAAWELHAAACMHCMGISWGELLTSPRRGHVQEALEKTDSAGKLLPEMVRRLQGPAHRMHALGLGRICSRSHAGSHARRAPL